MAVRNREPLKAGVKLWFEYLKLAYQSDDLEVQSALNKSKTRYAKWGDIGELDFNEWWDTHRGLFEEPAVRLVTNKRDVSDELDGLAVFSPLYFEVHLRKSVGALVSEFRETLQIVLEGDPAYREITRSY
jgi:hypothetical protein